MSGDMLSRLPPEVLYIVTEQLANKTDLKSLSQVSKDVHAAVAKVLYQSVTIRPWSEFDLHRIAVATLPQTPLSHVTQLRFHSDIRYATSERCPHSRDFDSNYDTEDEDGFEAEDDGDKEQSRFERLTQKVKSLLERLEDGQLRGFSWDLGTCVSSEIFGSHGIISIRQPQLQSLSLTTDYACRCYDYDCEIELSSFCQLRNISWRAPNVENFDALSVAIRSNANHLQRLELDFVDWQTLYENLGFGSEDEDEGTGPSYFAGEILRLDRGTPRPLFPVLRELSLSQVPLVAAMAYTINFDILQTLILRKCPAWNKFLNRVIRLRLPIRLKTLEIQDTDEVSKGLGEFVIAGFLDAFEGLEDLFISLPGPVSSIQLWNHVVRHQATLRRFVQHQRTVNLNEESPYFEEELDLPDLAIDGREFRRIEQDPSQNPLMSLNLECIGLACVPELLEPILRPFMSKTSLEFLHIRQTASDLVHYPSWAVDQAIQASDASSEVSSENWESDRSSNLGTTSLIREAESVTAGDEAGDRRHLQDRFRRFAEWAFGPQGLASLQVIAYGDFAHGGRADTNLLLCRSLEGGSNFQLLNRGDQQWRELVDKYRNVLEACPMESLLVYDSN